MCLLVAFNDKEKVGNDEFFVGYKIYDKEDGNPKNKYGLFALNTHHIRQLNPYNGGNIDVKWHELYAINTLIYHGIGSSTYPSGFHIFLNKTDCKLYHRDDGWVHHDKKNCLYY